MSAGAGQVAAQPAVDQDDPYSSSVLGASSWRTRRQQTVTQNEESMFSEQPVQNKPAAGPRPDLTSLLYASNNAGLTSGKGLFGADAIGGGDGGFGGKSGGGMFDDDEDDIFGSKAPAAKPAAPA